MRFELKRLRGSERVKYLMQLVLSIALQLLLECYANIGATSSRSCITCFIGVCTTTFSANSIGINRITC